MSNSQIQSKNSIVTLTLGNNATIQAPYHQLSCECNSSFDAPIPAKPNSYHQIAMNTKCWNPYDNNQIYMGNSTAACDLRQLVIRPTL